MKGAVGTREIRYILGRFQIMKTEPNSWFRYFPAKRGQKVASTRLFRLGFKGVCGSAVELVVHPVRFRMNRPLNWPGTCMPRNSQLARS